MTHHRLPIPITLCVALCTIWLLFYAPAARAWVSPTTHDAHPGVVRHPYQPPQHNWLSGHRGVDLAAAPGDPIYAAGAGTVAFVGVVAGSPIISIDHVEGIRTTYQPVHAQVERGDAVAEGQIIGTLGGIPAQRHSADSGLHWGARILPTDDRYINPLSLLPTPIIRLKPVDGPARRPSANAENSRGYTPA